MLRVFYHFFDGLKIVVCSQESVLVKITVFPSVLLMLSPRSRGGATMRTLWDMVWASSSLPLCCFLVVLVGAHIKLQDEIRNTTLCIADDSNFWSFWQKSHHGRSGRLNPLSFIPIQWQKWEYSLIFPRVISLNRAQLDAAELPRSQPMAELSASLKLQIMLDILALQGLKVNRTWHWAPLHSHIQSFLELSDYLSDRGHGVMW